MKKRIIVLSIVSITLIFIGVLFGFVFCVRNQTVSYLDKNIKVTQQELINTAGLKNGTPIFTVDKDSATSKIESKYPYLKVVQIKTVSVTEIQIVVDSRKELYYVEYDNSAYILAKELKVLKIEDLNNGAEFENLIEINNKIAKVNKDTKECDFVGNNYYQNITKNLYNAIYKNAVKKVGEEKQYLTHDEVLDLVKNVKMSVGATLSGECDVLVVALADTTSFGTYGETIEIWKPNDNLDYKFNACFSTLISLHEKSIDAEKITFGYDADDKAKLSYFVKN